MRFTLILYCLTLFAGVRSLTLRCTRDLQRRACTSAEQPCATIEHDLSQSYSGPDNGVSDYCMPNYCQSECPRDLDTDLKTPDAKAKLWLAAFETHFEDFEAGGGDLGDIVTCLENAPMHSEAFSECFTTTPADRKTLGGIVKRSPRSDCLGTAASLAAPPNLGGGGALWYQAVKVLGRAAAAAAVTWYCNQLPN